jgi:hypothetical protein
VQGIPSAVLAGSENTAGTDGGSLAIRNNVGLNVGVENAHLRPITRLLGDELLMSRRFLIAIMVGVALEHHHQRHIVVLVVDRPLVLLGSRARGKMDRTGMISQISMASRY